MPDWLSAINFIDLATPVDFSQKCFLARFDFNVPLAGQTIVDDSRLRQALPVIKYLLNSRAKILAISHLGRDGAGSLLPVFNWLQQQGLTLAWSPDWPTAIKLLADNQLVLLENLRRWPEETANDLSFALGLASHFDFYLNEAFSVCHRQHLSVVGWPKLLPAFAGPHLRAELSGLAPLLQADKKFCAIIGGAKISTKLPLLEKLLSRQTEICLAGALANSVLLARGHQVGQSLVEMLSPELQQQLNHPKLLLPVDVVVRRTNGKRVVTVSGVSADEQIVDIGPATIELFHRQLAMAELVLWNGPLGLVEETFVAGTREVLSQLPATDMAYVVAGGGDSLAFLHHQQLTDRFSFISTAGGALLDYLATDASLPGLTALALAPKIK